MLSTRTSVCAPQRAARGLVCRAADGGKRAFGSGWKPRDIKSVKVVPPARPQNPKEAVDKVESSTVVSAPAVSSVEVDWIITKLGDTEEEQKAVSALRKKVKLSASDSQGRKMLRFGVYSDAPQALVGFIEMGVVQLGLDQTKGTLMSHVYSEAKQRIEGEEGDSSADMQTLAFLTEVAVDPAYQRQGIGRKLVDTVVKASKEIGIPRMVMMPDGGLEAVSGDFWKSVGFGTISRSNDELVGSKSIRAQVEKELAEKMAEVKDAGGVFDEQLQGKLAAFMKSRLQTLMVEYKTKLDTYMSSLGAGTMTEEEEQSEQSQIFMADFAKKIAEALLFSPK